MKAAALAALVACGAVPVDGGTPDIPTDGGRQASYPLGWVEPMSCKTTCGLVSTDISCRQLQQVENLVVAAFVKRVKGWKPAAVCKALDGWDVRRHAFYSASDLLGCTSAGWGVSMEDTGADGGVSSAEWCIVGYTHRVSHSVEINAVPLQSSALAHELGHVVTLGLGYQVGHCAWIKMGLRQAIIDVSGDMYHGELGVVARKQETADCEPDK